MYFYRFDPYWRRLCDLEVLCIFCELGFLGGVFLNGGGDLGVLELGLGLGLGLGRVWVLWLFWSLL